MKSPVIIFYCYGLDLKIPLISISFRRSVIVNLRYAHTHCNSNTPLAPKLATRLGSPSSSKHDSRINCLASPRASSAIQYPSPQCRRTRRISDPRHDVSTHHSSGNPQSKALTKVQHHNPLRPRLSPPSRRHVRHHRLGLQPHHVHHRFQRRLHTPGIGRPVHV